MMTFTVRVIFLQLEIKELQAVRGVHDFLV